MWKNLQMTSEELHDAFAKTCVVVPAYNEENSIADVVTSVFAHMPGATVAVIDDGSRDRTADRAKTAGATVLSLPINLGIGGAVQTGYKFALRHDFAFALQIDGDGQHDPSESYHLFGPLLNDSADVVIGSRWLGRGNYVAPRSRRFGMKFLESLVSRKAGARYSDTTSGFRAMNERAVSLFATDYPADYPEVESILLARHHGLRVVEVPVVMKPREHGTSSIRGLRTLYFMFRITIGLLTGVIGGSES